MKADLVANEVITRGFSCVPSLIAEKNVDFLREKLSNYNKIHNSNLRVDTDCDMVHNCHELSLEFLAAFQHPLIDECLKILLGHSYLIYAFQSSSLPPCGSNNARRIHCDSPRVIPNYITNVGAIIALDDYTKKTGAIEFLPNSFNLISPPTEHTFVQESKQVICPSGSVILFNARTFHREGINFTHNYRHSLTVNFCRCYMRQRFDFVRMAAASGSLLLMSESQRKLIGYDVRMPTSLDEFFMPEGKRLYKANQE